MTSLFGHPVVAVALGALLGVVLTIVAERAASSVTPGNPFRGLAIVIVMTGVRLTGAVIALAAYSYFAPAGLVPFGFTLGVSFVAGLGIEALRISLRNATHMSA